MKILILLFLLIPSFSLATDFPSALESKKKTVDSGKQDAGLLRVLEIIKNDIDESTSSGLHRTLLPLYVIRNCQPAFNTKKENTIFTAKILNTLEKFGYIITLQTEGEVGFIISW